MAAFAQAPCSQGLIDSVRERLSAAVLAHQYAFGLTNGMYRSAGATLCDGHKGARNHVAHEPRVNFEWRFGITANLAFVAIFNVVQGR